MSPLGRMGRTYRRIYSRLVRRPSNFGWVVKDRLAGSGRPMTRSDLEWMKKQGVKAVVSLTEDPLPDGWINESGLRYLHAPLRDHMPPSTKEIERAVGFVIDQMSEGRPVAVHCAAGQGRTGTILASYFVRHDGISAEEAIKKVRRLRPLSIEGSQEASLYRYEKHLKSKAKE